MSGTEQLWALGFGRSQSVRDCFEVVTGLRPMTPDGTPLVGATSIRNLYLNTGHGTLGWTMACGSAQVLADQIMGRQPAINTEGFDMGRYTPHRSQQTHPMLRPA